MEKHENPDHSDFIHVTKIYDCAQYAKKKRKDKKEKKNA